MMATKIAQPRYLTKRLSQAQSSADGVVMVVVHHRWLLKSAPLLDAIRASKSAGFPNATALIVHGTRNPERQIWHSCINSEECKFVMSLVDQCILRNNFLFLSNFKLNIYRICPVLHAHAQWFDAAPCGLTSPH